MIKHARMIQRTAFALLAACLLTMAGEARAATVNLSDTFKNTGVFDYPYVPNGNVDLSNPTDTPVGALTTANGFLYGTVTLNAPGGGSNYNIAAYNAPIGGVGAIDLNGRSLTIEPSVYYYEYQNTPASAWAYHSDRFGVSGDVLRLYSPTAGGSASVTAKNVSGTTGQGNGILGYTGGTYLESGTLAFESGTVFPPGFGPFTLGAHNNTGGQPSNLVIRATGLTAPELLIRNDIATLTANEDVHIARFILDTHATAFEIVTPVGSPSTEVQIAAGYTSNNDRFVVNTLNPPVVKVIGNGRLNYNMVNLGTKTVVDLSTNGATFRTAATGDQTMALLHGGSAGNTGTLQAHATTGVLYLEQLTGAPIIDIPHFDEVVSAPANATLTAVQQAAAPAQGGTLRARANGSYAVSFIDTSVPYGAPRLDIDSGATVNDLRTAAARQFNGLNGAGQLVMSGTPGTLTLTPYLDSSYSYAGGIQTSVAVVALDANRGYKPAAEVVQTLGGTNARAGNLTYVITEGVLAFTSPAAIKSAGPGALRIETPGGGVATLSLAYASGGYDFSGTGTLPPGAFDITNGATLSITPAAGNCGAAIGNLDSNAVHATFELDTIVYAPGDVLNLSVDFSRTPVGTGYVKLLSSTAGVFAGASAADFPLTATGTSNVTLDPAVSISADGKYLYIGYKKTSSGGGGGGGSVTDDRFDVVLDMSDLRSADLSGGKLTVVSGDASPGIRTTYDLSKQRVKIVADENDPASIANAGSLFTITFKYPAILSGVPITVSFKDSAGTKTSFTTTVKIADGVSVLEFPAAGLPSGTYEVALSSPTGRNPFYEGVIAAGYAYTAPRGLVFRMTAARTNDGRGITSFVTVTSADIAQTGVDVVFSLEAGDGSSAGPAYERTTGADGGTGAVTFPNLAGGSYTVRASAAAFNVETESVIAISGDTDEGGEPGETTGGSGSSGCDAGFGAFALLAAAGGAVTLRGRR